MPDWADVHHELARECVTFEPRGEEYEQAQHEGYRYSRFSRLYRTWRSELDLPMRQTHKASEKPFVDYRERTLLVTDMAARRGVGVPDASNGMYAEAC